MQFYRESGSGALWLLCADDVSCKSGRKLHQKPHVLISEGFYGFSEYLKNGSTDFDQTYVIFGQSSIVSFEIKRLKTGHSLLQW